MQNARRLVEHYEQKYRQSNYTLVKPVPVVRSPRDRFEMAALISSTSGGGRYLEIGAGSGNIALTVSGRYDELVLTELSNVRMNELKKLFKGHVKVKVIQHNIGNDALDFQDEYFDTVVMVAVIEHLVDPKIALKELHRVLKPGGRLMIDTPNIAKWTRRIKLLLGYFPSTASLDEGLLSYDKKTPTDLYDDGHLHYFTFRSLSRLCITGRFSKVEWFGYGSWKTTRTHSALSRLLPTIFSEVFLVAYK
jgi:SAM-dependent methyltransferase